MLISTIEKAHNIVKNVNERFTLEKLENFIIEFKYDTISDGSKEKFLKLLADKSKTPEELSRLIGIVLIRLDRTYKAKLLAKLVNGMQAGLLRYDQLDDMAKILENWFESDESTLRHFAGLKELKEQGSSFSVEYPREQRLTALGLISSIRRAQQGGELAALDPGLTTYGNIMLALINVTNISTDYSSMGTGYSYSFAGTPIYVTPSKVLDS